MRKPIKFHDSLSYKHHTEKSDDRPKGNRSIYSECRISVYKFISHKLILNKYVNKVHRG